MPDRSTPLDKSPETGYLVSAMNDVLTKTLVAVVNSGAPGATVTPQGCLVNPASGLVVTLTSDNFEPNAAGPAIGAFVSRYAEVAFQRGLLFGVFQLPSGRYSIDLNILRPESDRARVAAFAHANNQHSYWDARLGDCAATGCTGEEGPRVNTANQVATVAALFANTDTDPAEVIRRW